MLEYRMIPHRKEGGLFWYEVPDFPDFYVCGGPEDDELAVAADGLARVIELRLSERDPLPSPSPAQPGDIMVAPKHLATGGRS